MAETERAPVLIESSAWRQGAGEDPSRVVLRNVGGYQPFATHIEVRRESGETFCVAGNYFTSSMAATEDFQKRVAGELRRPVVEDPQTGWPTRPKRTAETSNHPIVGLVTFAGGLHYDSRLPGLVPRGWEPGQEA